MSSRNSQIKDIAEIIAGYTFRSAIIYQGDGSLSVVQAKNIRDNIYVNKDDLMKTVNQDIQTAAYVKKNDVVLSSRGKHQAAMINFDVDNLIASSSLYILRVNTKDIIPEYLVIYLNSLTGQRLIKEIVSGALIKIIPKKDLINLPIKILSLERQKQIIELYQNNKKQEEKLKRKIMLTNEIGEVLISRLLN